MFNSTIKSFIGTFLFILCSWKGISTKMLNSAGLQKRYLPLDLKMDHNRYNHSAVAGDFQGTLLLIDLSD